MSNSALEMASSMASSATRKATVSVSAMLCSEHKETRQSLVLLLTEWCFKQNWNQSKNTIHSLQLCKTGGSNCILSSFILFSSLVLLICFHCLVRVTEALQTETRASGRCSFPFMFAVTYPVSAVNWESEEKWGQSGTEAANKRAEQTKTQQESRSIHLSSAVKH